MKRLFLLFPLLLLLSLCLFSCKSGDPLDPNQPVTLTMWHNFGGQMKDTLDILIDEFNQTVGLSRGIIINVTAISSSADLQEKLALAAAGEPGAPKLPDMTTAYPKTAFALAANGLLAALDAYFTDDELNAYVPAFVEEGRINGSLYVFPLAKSTEVLFVNTTLFDRFAQACDIDDDCFETFEGIAAAAEAYYEWTDAQTPDIPFDGKAFYMPDSWFNLAQVGSAQLGGSLITGNTVDYSAETTRRIFETLYAPAAKGCIVLSDSYSSEYSKTGEIICSTGSTAGILFYVDTVTYSDNTIEHVEYAILPYPVFSGGETFAIQRGNGLCVTASTEQKQYAASVFIKWLTAAEQNMRFVSQTGYLPVTNNAFGDMMAAEIDAISNENIRALLQTAIAMHSEYDFYIPPVFDAFDELEKSYNKGMKSFLLAEQADYIKKCAEATPESAFRDLAADAYTRFTVTVR